MAFRGKGRRNSKEGARSLNRTNRAGGYKRRRQSLKKGGEGFKLRGDHLEKLGKQPPFNVGVGIVTLQSESYFVAGNRATLQRFQRGKE